MALVRTRLSFERTMMSWVRTAAALISFGFTLAKADQYLEERGVRATFRFFGMREFSVLIIAIGFVSVTLATIQHLRHARMLHRLDRELPILSVGQVVAIAFVLIGACVLVEAILSQY
jgi:putative membrane protein